MWARATTSTKWMSERVRAQIKTENEHSAQRRKVSPLARSSCFNAEFSQLLFFFLVFSTRHFVRENCWSAVARVFHSRSGTFPLSRCCAPIEATKIFADFSFVVSFSTTLGRWLFLDRCFFSCHIPSLRIEQSERIMWFINAMRGK